MSRRALRVLIPVTASLLLMVAWGGSVDLRAARAADASHAPRGGTTRGAPVELDTRPSPAWQALQEQGIAPVERDRRAILAMAGDFRVSFEFFEVAAFTGDGTRAQPYQSWGTERVFVDLDEPHHISLVHVLEMHMIDAAGKPMAPMVTKHWRQDWRYEPEHVVEYQGAERWARRELSAAERQGKWSQTVYQVDEAPRYGALGRWQHSAAFSSWIGNETARPLPRREWTVRDDYSFLLGTNRHTIMPAGWLQEENNLKVAAPGAATPYVGREYGVARYERIGGNYFVEATAYYQSTRAYWNQVMAVWDEIWSGTRTVSLRASSDRSGAYADLFRLADEYAAGRISLDDAKHNVRDSLRAAVLLAPVAAMMDSAGFQNK
ncbi:MAG: hypothetical protein QM696_05130 [Steroidobacteraceae bacterium]